MTQEFSRITELIKQRNIIEQESSKILGRPFIIGHVGEYIASQIFDITLNTSASAKSHDGYFNRGAIKGSTVNIKYYSRKSSILDLCKDENPDYYLVLMGSSDKKEFAPWDIESVYLFDSKDLVKEIEGKVKMGIATSIRKELWNAAMVYPNNINKKIVINNESLEMLRLLKPVLEESN